MRWRWTRTYRAGSSELEFAGEGGGGADAIGVSGESIGKEAQLLGGFLDTLRFEGFADAGEGFGAIAGIFTGGREQALVPVPAGEAFGAGEGAFGEVEGFVELLQFGLVEGREAGVEGADGGAPGAGGEIELFDFAFEQFPGQGAGFGQFLEVFDVLLEEAGDAAEVEGDDVGIGHAGQAGGHEAGKGGGVDVVGIAEVLEPAEGVVDGVVYAGHVAIEAGVEAGDAEVVGEGGVVAAGAEGSGVEGLAVGELEQGAGSGGFGGIAEPFLDEFFERGGGLDGHGAAEGGVGIEVSDGFALEAVAVLFGPFGGADEAVLFGIPEGEDEGALGAPALLSGLGEDAGGLEDAGGAADGVGGAIDPGVVVVAVKDDLIGESGATEAGDDIVNGADGVVVLELEVD